MCVSSVLSGKQLVKLSLSAFPNKRCSLGQGTPAQSHGSDRVTPRFCRPAISLDRFILTLRMLYQTCDVAGLGESVNWGRQRDYTTGKPSILSSPWEEIGTCYCFHEVHYIQILNNGTREYFSINQCQKDSTTTPNEKKTRVLQRVNITKYLFV